MIYTAWIKRMADFLEKMAVAALIMGFFQDNTNALSFGTLFLLPSLLLTERK